MIKGEFKDLPTPVSKPLDQIYGKGPYFWVDLEKGFNLDKVDIEEEHKESLMEKYGPLKKIYIKEINEKYHQPKERKESPKPREQAKGVTSKTKLAKYESVIERDILQEYREVQEGRRRAEKDREDEEVAERKRAAREKQAAAAEARRHVTEQLTAAGRAAETVAGDYTRSGRGVPRELRAASAAFEGAANAARGGERFVLHILYPTEEGTRRGLLPITRTDKYALSKSNLIAATDSNYRYYQENPVRTSVAHHGPGGTEALLTSPNHPLSPGLFPYSKRGGTRRISRR